MEKYGDDPCWELRPDRPTTGSVFFFFFLPQAYFLFITVSRSKCPSYIGVSGILLQETKNAFKIITKDDKLKSEYHFYHYNKDALNTMS